PGKTGSVGGTLNGGDHGGSLDSGSPRLYGPQQQQQQQQQQEQEGGVGGEANGGRTAEAQQQPQQPGQQQPGQQQEEGEQGEHLSETCIHDALWLLSRLMKELPEMVNIIEAHGKTHQPMQFVEMIQAMITLLTGSQLEKAHLAEHLPAIFKLLFKLDRLRRENDHTKGVLLEFICDAMERHPELYVCLKDETIVQGLTMFFVLWHDKKASIEYNATYSSMYYDLLLKGCLLYPSFLEAVKSASSLIWSMEWFLLRGYAPSFKMATTLMSIFTLCLRKYGAGYSSHALSWTLGPHAKEVYLKVGDGPNPRLPLYALWMIEACVRRPQSGWDSGPEGDAMETFIKCGGLDQVTELLAHVMHYYTTERTLRQQQQQQQQQQHQQQTPFGRSSPSSHYGGGAGSSQEVRRKVAVLCERVILSVHGWLNEGREVLVPSLRRRDQGGVGGPSSSRRRGGTQA
ncbi:unnamed protein product, partial [Ectocarpus sp. 12 AP-2014]